MDYLLLCALTFFFAYCVNMTYMSVFYHRALTHGAVKLRPWARAFVVWSGNWVTGLDPKTWCCMHRMHHLYSDTSRDPHSPLKYGVPGVLLAQLRSYSKTMAGLVQAKGKYTALVTDLDFPVNWLNRKHVGLLPYVFHGAIGLSLGWCFGFWLLGLAYFLGIMSHPIQGWMVNALGHRYGYRNFATDDNSKNNIFVAWFVMGEGFQNNHHYKPASPKFSVRWWEFDPGFILCRIAQGLRFIDIKTSKSGKQEPKRLAAA